MSLVRALRSVCLRLALIAAAGCALSAPREAHAQSDDNRAAADALFDAARTLMNEEKYAEACPKFRDSHALDPGVGTLLNLGRCYELDGKTASAWSTYREAAALARQLGQGEREQLSRDEVQRLESKLTRFVVEVDPEAADIEGLTVSRAGKALPKTMWGVPVPMDPGLITVEATAPGYTTRKAGVLVEGEGKTISFRVPMLTKGAEAATTVAASDEAEPDQQKEPEAGKSSHKRSVVPYILGGVGVVGLATGGIFTALALKDLKSSKAICEDETAPCSAQDVSTHESLKNSTARNWAVSYVGYGVGAAALATAVVLFVMDKPASKTGFEILPVSLNQGGMLQASGSF